MSSVTALSQGSGRILRAGARCRRPPDGNTRIGAQIGWPKIVDKSFQSEQGGRREEGRRREEGGGTPREGGRNREEGGRSKEGGKKEGLVGAPGESLGAPWELASGAWELLGAPCELHGCSWGNPRGCLGVLGLLPGALGMFLEALMCSGELLGFP